MSFADDHASALADILASGQAVTFVSTVEAYDETLGRTTTGASTSVSGGLLRKKGNPLVYAAMDLLQLENITGLWCSSTYGERPKLGSTVQLDAGKPFTLKSLDAVAPDGKDIVANVIVSR